MQQVQGFVQPKILNNLSTPSLNYFKIRHFVHAWLPQAGLVRHHNSALCLPAFRPNDNEKLFGQIEGAILKTSPNKVDG